MKKWIRKQFMFFLALAVLLSIVPQNRAYAKENSIPTVKGLRFDAGEDYIYLMWKPARKVSGFYVYKSVNSGKFKKVATVKDTEYYDWTEYEEGTEVSYYVCAYKQNKGKVKIGKPSKTRKFVVPEKPNKARNQARALLINMVKEQGVKSILNTYVVANMSTTGGSLVSLGLAYEETSDMLGFQYVTYDGNGSKMIELMYVIGADEDPMYVYTVMNMRTLDIYTLGATDIDVSTVTKETVLAKEDFPIFTDYTDGSIDHFAEINKGLKILNEYIYDYCQKTDGIELSDLGLTSYK